MLTEDRLAAVTASFQDAALGRETWQASVEAYTSALHFAHGQLVAFGRDSLVTLNVVSGEALIELERFGGHSPTVNSRVRLGSRALELQFLDERDFTTEADRLANRQYSDWMDRHDVGYSCVTPLHRQGGMLVGLAGLRARSQDALNAAEQRAFMAVAANIRSAVNLALAVEGQKADTLTAVLGASSTPAFVCDGGGRISAANPASEAVLSSGRFGRLTDGMFTPRLPRERARFDAALKSAIGSGPAASAPRSVLLTSDEGERAIAEFIPLTSDAGFTFMAPALVVLRGVSPPPSRNAEIAQELFGLTPTEAKVAGGLLEGRSPQDIASLSGTSVGTVRNHVHRILSKAHCRSQVEFLALFRDYV